MQSIDTKSICSICGGGRVESIIDLPQFPLTGIFIELGDTVDSGAYFFDQQLYICLDCSHMQLARLLSPEKLYGQGYAHRSSVSHLAPNASTFLSRYIRSIGKGRKFACVLEVGCNDLLLIEKLEDQGNRFVGVDPIWMDREPDTEDHISIIGDFIENVDLEGQIGAKPDLIVSAHNLEHLHDPVQQLQRLMEVAADDALFVIEVPDAGVMVENLRFDQVFHQHVHYFNIASFLKMVEQVNGHYLGHTINYRNWGGSLVVAFTKSPAPEENSIGFTESSIDRELVGERYGIFKRRMAGFMELVSGLDCDIFGYGAGQMVPSVAYNLGSRLDFLKGIVDDDPSRHGLKYPYLVPSILAGDGLDNIEESAVLVTALDGTRAILRRLEQLGPRFTLMPIDVF